MRVRFWLPGTAAALIVAGFSAYFLVADVNTASEVAGIAGLFVGLAGLAVSVYGIWQAQRDTPPARDSQVVSSSRAGGRITQVREVQGSVRIGETPPHLSLNAPQEIGFRYGASTRLLHELAKISATFDDPHLV